MRTRLAVCAVVFALLASMAAEPAAQAANSIGINAASTYGSGFTYPVTGTDGLVPQGNWNNIGTDNINEGCGVIAVGNLINNSGSPSGATLSYTLAPYGRNPGGNTIIGNQGPLSGRVLFKGGLSAHYGRCPNLVVTNIPYARYDLIAYLYKANSESIGAILDIPGYPGQILHSVITVTSDGGDFTQFNDATTDAVGNYIKWPGLTSSSFLLSMKGGPDRSQFVALQIVELKRGTLLIVR
jgi:hypothetical protein